MEGKEDVPSSLLDAVSWLHLPCQTILSRYGVIEVNTKERVFEEQLGLKRRYVE